LAGWRGSAQVAEPLLAVGCRQWLLEVTT